MVSRQGIVLSVTACAAGVLAVVLLRESVPLPLDESTDEQRAIAVRLIEPAAGPDGVIVADPGTTVNVSYEVRNVTRRVLGGLRSEPFCQCSIRQDLPESLQPGESAIISFSVRVPDAGTRKDQLPLLAADFESPLVVLAPLVRASVLPPRVVYLPDHLSIHVFQSQESRNSVQVTTVERREAKNAIDSLVLEPARLGLARLKNVDEQESLDPDIVRRNYTFSISPTAKLDTGTFHGLGKLIPITGVQLHGRMTFPVTVGVLTAVSVLPAELVFPPPTETTASSRKVSVVTRGMEHVEVTVADFDSDLIEVEKVNGGRQISVFRVEQKKPTSGPLVSQIVFTIIDGDQSKHTIELPITFQ